MVVHRDLDAAINLARWQPNEPPLERRVEAWSAWLVASASAQRNLHCEVVPKERIATRTTSRQRGGLVVGTEYPEGTSV